MVGSSPADRFGRQPAPERCGRADRLVRAPAQREGSRVIDDVNHLFGLALNARSPEEPADHHHAAADAGAGGEAFVERFASTCAPDGGVRARGGKEPVERG